MNAIIGRYRAVADADLMLCYGAGVAYQHDNARVTYDKDYLAKVDAYEGTDIAQAVNAGRCALLSRWLEPGSSVLDIGAGSGAFVRAARAAGFQAKGFDVIAEAAARLRAEDLYADDPLGFVAVTLWDTLEHMEDPKAGVKGVRPGGYLFASLPVFTDLASIRRSKHYRPGEHLYYWTAAGFVAWAAYYGFLLLEQSAHETEAGRDGIGAFAFRRDNPERLLFDGAMLARHGTALLVDGHP